jgi:hypothetical protein
MHKSIGLPLSLRISQALPVTVPDALLCAVSARVQAGEMLTARQASQAQQQASEIA